LKQKAVFLDRDGTINADPGYLGDPEKFHFLPGVIGGLKRLHEAGYLIFVVSNQSGIARGFFKDEDLRKIHDKMTAALAAEGISLDGIYYCPHHPAEQCSCRKPSPKMVLDASCSFDIDLKGSFFIGDRASDIETGKNAGCGAILVLTGAGAETLRELPESLSPDHIAGDLAEAVSWILGGQGENKNRF
jgi:D,D-heptose 1,7-bisphosphate phosphatase